MKKHVVPEGVEPMPLSAYLRRAFPRIPAALLKETLKKRDVRIDGVKSDAQASVQGGCELTLYLDDRYLSAPIRILYEDEQMLAVEKPAGLPVDCDADHVGADTMLLRLRAYWPGACLAHRLDTGTPRPREADCRAFLLKDAAAARVRVVFRPASGALPIETAYRVLETRGDMSLIEVRLITGRTHQIRAHLSALGYPLLGDDKYGDRAFNRAHHASQPALWCVRLALNGKTFESRAPFEDA